jgi:hypothetical protein
MEQSPHSEEADSHSAGKNFPAIYVKRRFIGLPCSQESTTKPYSKQLETTSHPPFVKNPFQ